MKVKKNTNSDKIIPIIQMVLQMIYLLNFLTKLKKKIQILIKFYKVLMDLLIILNILIEI